MISIQHGHNEIITLEYPIKAMGAVRMTRKGKYVNEYALRYMQYKSIIRTLTRNQFKNEVLESALEVDCRFYFKPPKSYTKKRLDQIFDSQYPFTKKPDIDNLIKGITDALNGLVYKDDSQIVKATMSKNYGQEDKIFICINKYEEGVNDKTKDRT